MRTWEQMVGKDAKPEERSAFILSCLSNFRFFCEKVLGLEVKPFHEEWIDSVQTFRKICILASRQHGKTEILGVAYPLWFSLRAKQVMEASEKKGLVRREVSILIVSGSLKQSTRSLKKIRLTVEQNEFLRDLLMTSTKDDDWSKTSLSFKTGAHLSCEPFSSSILGSTVDLLICDDLLRQEEFMVDISIEKFNDILSPIYEFYDAQVAVVGTPMSSDDLYAQLRESGTFKYNEYPACKIHDDGTLSDPLWPERYPIDKLRSKQNEIGVISFARQYLIDPMKAGESLFPRNLIDACVDKRIIPLSSRKNSRDFEYFLGVDIAMSRAEQADFTVLAVVELNHKDKLVRLVHLQRHKGWSGKMIIDECVRLHELFNFQLLHVEEKGLSKDIVLRLQDSTECPTTYLRTQGYKTGARGQEKERLVTRLQTGMAQGQFFFYPEKILMNELSKFGIKRKRIGGMVKESLEAMSGHDDTVIATALAFDAATTQYTTKASLSLV